MKIIISFGGIAFVFAVGFLSYAKGRQDGRTEREEGEGGEQEKFFQELREELRRKNREESKNK